MKRLLGFLAAMTALSASSPAATLICQIAAGANAKVIATRYKITFLDQAYKSPFVLYEVVDDAEGDRIQALMGSDKEIVWAEDDGDISAPEGEGLRGALKKGSILPAVGERKVLYDANPNMLAQIGWDPVLGAQSTRSVRVAILDTGLSPRVKYLWAKTVGGINFVDPGLRPYDLPAGDDTNGNGVLDEGAGHGTMVTGLIDQVAPNARFIVCRVADSDGVASVWTLIQGLAYAVATKCEVANVSLGTLQNLPAISDVMDWCERKKLTVIAAIGNNGLKGACEPAAYSDVVCVGGLASDGTKAPFSNWKNVCDVSAPAVGVSSAWWDNRVATWSGTSFATPLVTGILANCLGRRTPISPGELRARIKNAGYSLDPLNPKYKKLLGTGLHLTMFDNKIRATLP